MMQTQELKLTRRWDKTFPKSDKVRHSKVTFVNRYGVTLAADLYIPKGARGRLPAIAVSGTAVAGLVVWGVASHIGRQPAAEPAPAEVAVVADTAAIVPEDTFVVEEIQPAVPAKPAPVVQREMPAAKPEEVKTSVVEKPAQAKPEPFHGRPVIINVDTVKENVPSDEELRKRNSQIIVE